MSLTDVPGLKVGHWTNLEAATGCTVVLCPEGAVAGVDVRGSAPGTRETDLLNPINLVEKVNAILLSGGSAFGLAAAEGVMRWLEERGHGFDAGVAKVPIVPAAILFDVGIGSATVRPDAAAGYAACEAATSGPVAQGNVGAGTGATVGKRLGLAQATKGGLGATSGIEKYMLCRNREKVKRRGTPFIFSPPLLIGPPHLRHMLRDVALVNIQPVVERHQAALGVVGGRRWWR